MLINRRFPHFPLFSKLQKQQQQQAGTSHFCKQTDKNGSIKICVDLNQYENG